mmetsp:Transcript_2587/g.7659  ORF Transcript_2587/g.7659 Transcript_2587/m.7659 type:complete len:238 (+) Transcript_2587:118-831(+)
MGTPSRTTALLSWRMCDLLIRICCVPFSTMNSGRPARPESVYSRSSFSAMSHTMDTSGSICTSRRMARSSSTSSEMSPRWMPTHAPSANTLVACGMSHALISSRLSRPISPSISITGPTGVPTDTKHMSARFLIRPTPWPSGVSAGHSTPHCVLWSWRGLGSLLPLSTGVLRRRRCDSEDAYVRRLSTWDTPVAVGLKRSPPQLPVASAYFMPWDTMLLLMAEVTLKSLPVSTHFCM